MIIRPIILTFLLTPYTALILKLFFTTGILIIAWVLVCFLLEIRRMRQPKGNLAGKTLVSIKNTNTMRKQYSFLNKNGLKADGINLESSKLNAISAFSPSQSHVDISAILKAILRNFLVSQKATDFLNALLSAWKQYLTEGVEETPLNQICDLLSVHIVAFLKKSDSQLSDLIWLNSLSVLEEQVRLYRVFRAEVNLKADIKVPVHLDDFNDFECEDIGVQWSANTDKINDNIIARLRLAGKLHPAVGKSQYVEHAHLRQVFEVILASFDKSNTLLTNRALQLVLREVAVCQIMAPFINKISHPDIINPFILEKASRRLILKNTVNNFLKTLESQYLVFPPIFLLSQYAPANYTIAERSKYVDLVIKYTKRATSIIDLATVRHEVLRELKKRTEELGNPALI